MKLLPRVLAAVTGLLLCVCVIAASADGKLRTPDDLHGKRIAVAVGSAQEIWVSKNIPDATLLQYETIPDLVTAVATGKADATLKDQGTLKALLAANPTMAPLGESVFSSPLASAFRKGHPEVRVQFNDFLKKIRANGVYDDIIDRWMKRGEMTMPKIDQVPTNGTLTVGVALVGLPLAQIKDNEPSGLEFEIIYRFAAEIGKTPKIELMEVGGMIAAVASGKVDMVTALYNTEERRKKADFSDPIYEMGNQFVALKSNIAGYESETEAAGHTTPGFMERIKESFVANILTEKRYLMIWDGLQTTMIISVLSTIFGTALGGLVCLLRMSSVSWLNVPAKIYISILRGTPVLVLLMLIFYVVFGSVNISPTLVAVIAFGMNFAAYFAEIFRAGLTGIDNGQREGGIAMGFSPVQTFIHILLPQTIVRILPIYKGEFISLVKMTSVVGYIAVHDLTKAGDIIRSRTFDAFFPLVMVAVLYFLIAALFIQGLEYLERRTDPVARRRQGEKA